MTSQRSLSAGVTHGAGSVDGVAALLADGLVAELAAPALLAVALQGPVAGAVEAAGEDGAIVAVLTLPADVTAGREFENLTILHL